MRNNTLNRYLVFLITMLILVPLVKAQPEKLSNEAIISLTRAGFGPELIIQKIRISAVEFDLSTNALIELKANGVPEPVIEEMVKAKFGAPEPVAESSDTSDGAESEQGFGIFIYLESNGQIKRFQLAPNISVQNRTGGQFTAAIFPLGLGKIKTKANLPGRNANLQISTSKPVFYFNLDAQNGGLNTGSGVPFTPNEFKLVRFNLRSDNREITISKTNDYGIKEGLSDEYVIKFEFEHLGGGRFKVSPAGPLPRGEYAFFLADSGNSNVSQGIGAKFFDFGIR